MFAKSVLQIMIRSATLPLSFVFSGFRRIVGQFNWRLHWDSGFSSLLALHRILFFSFFFLVNLIDNFDIVEIVSNEFDDLSHELIDALPCLC